MNRATRLQTLLRLRIPSALPYFFAGLRISSGLALIGGRRRGVRGRNGRPQGGARLSDLRAGYTLDIPLMFAALALINVAGIALFVTMAGLGQLALRGWHESDYKRIAEAHRKD